MPPAHGRGSVTVRLDGGPPRRIVVDRQQLYTLAALPSAGRHALQLAFGDGTQAFAFTFG